MENIRARDDDEEEGNLYEITIQRFVHVTRMSNVICLHYKQCRPTYILITITMIINITLYYNSHGIYIPCIYIYIYYIYIYIYIYI